MKQRAVIGRQGGFALVGAIFLLVVLAALGTFMVTMGGVQTRTGLLALQGARAYHAARSGIEWGIYEDLNGGACSTGIFAVGDFTVTVSCAEDSYTEGGSSYKVYRIIALAEFGSYGSPDYVSRRLEAKVTDAAL